MDLWRKVVDLIIRPPRVEYEPERHLLGPKLNVGGAPYERVDFELHGPKGKLQCSHYRPSDPKAPAMPCVVYLHTNSGCRADANECAKMLLPGGICVATLDFGGSGLSDGKYISLGVRETEELAVLVEHLRAEGRTTKIGLWGRSMGAATAIKYGSTDPSIAGIVADSPFARLTDIMHELVDDYLASNRLAVPQFMKRLAISAVKQSVLSRGGFNIEDADYVAAAESNFCPALFGHGNDDDFVRPHHSERIFAAYAGDKNIVRFEGGHNDHRPEFFRNSVTIFFHNTLDPPPLPQPSDSIADSRAGPRTTFSPFSARDRASSSGPDAGAVAQASNYRPAPADVAKVVGMGFRSQDAELALRQHRSVELAIDWLVNRNAAPSTTQAQQSLAVSAEDAALAEAIMLSLREKPQAAHT
eukprot:CAMPEP_0183792478 /NCGR_PEP_ID=MMETSP0803_2-20130417/2602_1 /TAXON_ID=195967 /ORGANISM="Crustomastix stigmata, Strain CCMP3273" /LENGTH=414 /DNA_ID=CAMNT_0026036833 /DNA_START=219 /DNA_END=1463 /DNA_ORIENTATION=+